ncbi:hypothetical protein SAMN04490243_2515 [Robiginitalea myxolifaciens]|uniref:ChbG/HpnK family deacetylase n=1 Tax=Robiginitalea myxolifaciens TaxID=400055 RepID=A0A1I6HBL1_9FLAO|nr:polysaccharide deacetylase family protein [Robiginitalea myxolifaciens]SFR51774.1 hypothetical protein SAMN04490243_2515 [Robiginitalea myxolifaciens]
MNLKHSTILTILCLGIQNFLIAQENIATKLGYSPDAKLLIIHADDLGVSHSENMASLRAIAEGSVNSASVMMPTPWVTEVTEYAKANPDTHDFGLHLTLSSELKNYKWGPVASANEVPSLLNEYGFFHEACRTDLNLEEVEKEMKAQIEQAYSMGLSPTHFDTHMGCLVQTEELREVYLKMGQQYQIPVFVLNQFISQEQKDQYDVRVVVDEMYTMQPDDFNSGVADYYTKVLQGLKPGLSLILIHTAYDNEEMKGMTVDHPLWGNVWRQKDYDFFTSEACKTLLEESDIKLVTWRQLKEAYYD